jgi:hypothetical protein
MTEAPTFAPAALTMLAVAAAVAVVDAAPPAVPMATSVR